MLCDLKIGETVHLASDQRLMVIEDIQDGIAFCVWMHNGEQGKGQFSVTSLVKVVQDDGPQFIIRGSGKYEWVGPK